MHHFTGEYQQFVRVCSSKHPAKYLTDFFNLWKNIWNENTFLTNSLADKSWLQKELPITWYSDTFS
jgi:hypothetical protein